MDIENAHIKDLEVLILDCQATHSNPARGEVFEIGWTRVKGCGAFETRMNEKKIETHVVKLPGKRGLPRRIQKITGIQPAEFQSALSAKKAWHKLIKAAQITADKNKMSLCPVVIHYSRYEEPILRHLHTKFCPKLRFPFRIICTHQIIRQLIPGLPRKGLRTVSGYFGLSLPDSRRSLHHVLGTAFIWHHIALLLQKNRVCSTLEELFIWMETPPPRRMHTKPARTYPMTEEFRKDLPSLPGLYRMFRSNGDLLYIGKAKSLKRRVNSYFRNQGKHSEHILEMLSQAKALTFSVTHTALEAAVRESDEIKALNPPFNIALRLSGDGPFFTTPNFKSCRQKPDPMHRIGPMPSKIYIESLSCIMDVLNGNTAGTHQEVMEKILTITEEHIPDRTCFLEGIREFTKQHSRDLCSPVQIQSMMRLGSRLWKEWLEKRAAEQPADPQEETLVLKAEPVKKEKKQREISWSPEKVAKTIRHILRTGTHMIRRSRWLCLLSESSLAWGASEKGRDRRNLVKFQNGFPHFAEPIPIAEEIPIPSGSGKSRLARQHNFDVFTYDRLKVLTTEIRRILEESRTVELCLGPEFVLVSEQLRKILQWV